MCAIKKGEISDSAALILIFWLKNVHLKSDSIIGEQWKIGLKTFTPSLQVFRGFKNVCVPVWKIIFIISGSHSWLSQQAFQTVRETEGRLTAEGLQIC